MRTMMVMPTAAMPMLAIWSGVSFRSPLMTGISGATANQAKKQTKNAIHVRWKARICGVSKLNRSIRVALLEIIGEAPAGRG